MTVKAPFQPRYGSAQTVAPAVASATMTIGEGSKSLVFANTGANPCSVRVQRVEPGAAAVAATTADYLLRAGDKETISKGQDENTVTHISALGTTLTVIAGEGF